MTCRCKLNKNSFLFESVLAGEVIGRYSFLGSAPSDGKVLKTFNEDPLVALEMELSKRRFVKVKDLPDFTGGAVGYQIFINVQDTSGTIVCVILNQQRKLKAWKIPSVFRNQF